MIWTKFQIRLDLYLFQKEERLLNCVIEITCWTCFLWLWKFRGHYLQFTTIIHFQCFQMWPFCGMLFWVETLELCKIMRTKIGCFKAQSYTPFSFATISSTSQQFIVSCSSCNKALTTEVGKRLCNLSQWNHLISFRLPKESEVGSELCHIFVMLLTGKFPTTPN